jgi:hypothetical protein
MGSSHEPVIADSRPDPVLSFIFYVKRPVSRTSVDDERGDTHYQPKLKRNGFFGTLNDDVVLGQ